MRRSHIWGQLLMKSLANDHALLLSDRSSVFLGPLRLLAPASVGALPRTVSATLKCSEVAALQGAAQRGFAVT